MTDGMKSMLPGISTSRASWLNFTLLWDDFTRKNAIMKRIVTAPSGRLM